MRFKLVESLDEEVLSFSDWLDQKYGMGPDGLSGKHYDYWFTKYLVDYYINTDEGKDYSKETLRSYEESNDRRRLINYCDNLFSKAYMTNRKSRQEAKDIINRNNASEDDSNYEEGYFITMSNADIKNAIKELKGLLNINEAFEDDDFESSEQEFSSANTSINSSKLPAVFNKVKFNPGTINLDYGGGKFDNATEFLANQDVDNLIFDKFNRSDEHNKNVIKKIRQNGGADTATCSNVLNVIKERDIRVNEVIKNIYSLLKSGGTAYFTVYEGTGAGDSRETKAGYQLNKKTADYVEEIEEIFGKGNVVRKGSVIIAKK